MTLQQIIYFCAICEEKNYTKAANKIHVSQPCLSYSISKMESELDVKLLKKRGKQVIKTEYGELFYPYAKQVISSLEEGVTAIKNRKEQQKGQVNVGYLFSVIMDFLPLLIEEYYDYSNQRNHTFNFIPCKLSDVANNLILGKMDVAFATEDIEKSLIGTSLEMIPVYKQELYLVVQKQHPLAGRESVTFDEIKNQNYVAINPRKGLRQQMESYFRSQKVNPRIVFSVDDTESLITYVEAGVGVAILPKLPKMNMDKVSLLQISDYPITRNVVLVYSNVRSYNAEVRSLISFIEEKAASTNMMSI